MNNIDSSKVLIALIVGAFGLIALAMGYRFVSDHWEDIKSLAIIALVLGGTLTVAVGSFKLRSRR